MNKQQQLIDIRKHLDLPTNISHEDLVSFINKEFHEPKEFIHTLKTVFRYILNLKELENWIKDDMDKLEQKIPVICNPRREDEY